MIFEYWRGKLILRAFSYDKYVIPVSKVITVNGQKLLNWLKTYVCSDAVGVTNH